MQAMYVTVNISLFYGLSFFTFWKENDKEVGGKYISLNLIPFVCSPLIS